MIKNIHLISLFVFFAACGSKLDVAGAGLFKDKIIANSKIHVTSGQKFIDYATGMVLTVMYYPEQAINLSQARELLDSATADITIALANIMKLEEFDPEVPMKNVRISYLKSELEVFIAFDEWLKTAESNRSSGASEPMHDEVLAKLKTMKVEQQEFIAVQDEFNEKYGLE